MPHVVVDTNVFISLLTDRNEQQRALAKELLLRTEAGEIVAIALANHYDSVATFDEKLIRQMKNLGVAAYWAGT